ncbi:recombinase family protein [Anaerovorax odorimutans]|uniref:Recombinase family protein n=1 Tax=Anaerovorax odorimutans TaxID=109327 RepID=A0ABT1RP49_9FIRM|nr:recombinase family protein [Anaerovorax odorimutans]MCQ4636962.1 recombinase family protein [Anaerovorax odorimutans]
MDTKRLTQSAHYSAALYMRLSKDDEGSAGESASITNQRKLLRAYAREHNYKIYDEYIDDGISGTTFHRPAFSRMIQDIEQQKINMVITKDLSRLGRDYILAGQYTELYFPAKQVRYIAINDGYDSESPYTDIVPFKNVINEMYARDTSKKIRSAFETRMMEGSFVGPKAPYGYKRDPQDKYHLVIDEPAARVVREIFKAAAEGVLPKHIAENLNKRGVMPPSVYRCSNNPNLKIEDFSKRQEWVSATITKMVRNVVYLGHMVQGKTRKLSFKSNMTLNKPRDEWYIVENTHESLVSRETFDMAAKRSQQRTCKAKGKFSNVFSGIAKCADCGRNMSTVGTRKKGARANLACGGYKLYGSKECTNHFIDYDTLYNLVLTSIKEMIRLSEQEEEMILQEVKEKAKNKTSGGFQKEKKELEKRRRQLDKMIEQLYEDHAEGLIRTERMQKLVYKYERQCDDIDQQLQSYETQNSQEAKTRLLSEMKATLEEYINITELTPEILYRFIDRIEISQGYYEKTQQGKVKHQSVKIRFTFKGQSIMKEYPV